MNLHYIFPKIALYLLFTHAKKQFSLSLKNFLFTECGDPFDSWKIGIPENDFPYCTVCTVLYTVHPSPYELDKYFQDMVLKTIKTFILLYVLLTILTFSHQNLNIKKKKKKFHFVFFCKRIASFCILLYTVPGVPVSSKKVDLNRFWRHVLK